MKKLSLLLLTLCLSLATWAGVDDWTHLNPFAYDLKSEVIENGTQLKLTYSLNATAVTSDTYNEDHHGLQIYLIDENGNRIKKEDGTTWACTSGSYQKGKDHSVIIPIADLPPAAKDRLISWEVVVHGNKNRTKPKMVDDYYPVAADTPKDNYKPRAGHGIAVDKDPQSKWFGRIFVAEACTNTTGKNSVLEYDMLLNYRTFHHKDILDGSSSYFSSALNYEPHRVKISEDGRMFATCYHPNAISAVLEYMGNGEWKTVVEANTTVNQYQDEVIYGFDHKYNRRPIAMDIKGEGENLKILVAWMKPKGKKINNNLFAQIQCIEYNVGKNKYKLDQDNDGTIIAEYLDHAINESSTSPHGMLFNSYRLDYNQAKHGFVDVAYGDNGSIWLKVDFGFGVSEGRRSHIIRFDEGSIEPQYTYTFPSTSKYRSDGGYYGGSGLFVKGNQLITGSGASTILAYKIKADKTLDETDSNILSISTGSPGTKTWTNAIAEDYAGNLYCVSDTADNIIVVAMPYDGTRITRAPASQSIVLSDPVPNILATDLRYDIVRGKNQYEFSFNVNTKPEEAQIRFYESYDKMKNSLNVVNADNYDGTNNNKPLFVYNIPSDTLKQGRIAVKLGAVGGQVDANGVITNDRLPAGVLYWSVYVKTRESKAFAPIYTQPLTGEHEHNRLHATVNTHPETDNFGYIYATDYKTNNVCRLMVYSIGDANVNDEDEAHITSNTRYALLQNLTINQVVNTRRPAVAPDGYVFLTDFGASTDKIATLGPAGFDQGGIWVFDPNLLQNKSISGSASLTRFHSADETSSGVSFLGIGISTKLYKTNTYDEIARFPSSYNDTERLKNGYRIFNVGNNDGSIKHSMNLTDGTQVAIKTQSKGYGTTLKDVGGDANGNISIKATSDGVWLCQHRSGTAHENPSASSPNPDNFETTALMFQNNSGKRAFSSFEATVNGKSLSQTSTSIMQSTPGAGMTVSANEKYLYVVNHDGNILEFQIGGTSDAKTLTHTRTFLNTTQFKTISTLNFDYAGNLVASTDKSYPDMETQIVVFTMPYDRVNAREIQAPNSCRMIPERIAHLDMDKEGLDELIKEHKIDHLEGCAIDLYRPLQGGMFNTICLPFTLDLTELPEGHPLYEATLREYTGLNLTDIGGEKILELVFTDVANKTIIANKPYIIQPEENYNSIIRFAGPLQLTNTTGMADYCAENSNNYNMTFQGIIPYQEITPTIQDGVSLTLMLVADNRLAEMTTEGYMYGFRGYFQLNTPLPRGMQTRITTQKPVATNTTIVVDGKKVNVEKFLREGRVCIRVGETLYNVNGEVIGR